MKKQLLIILIVTLVYACDHSIGGKDKMKMLEDNETSSKSEHKKDFREVKWGMDYEQVAASEMMLETNQNSTNENQIDYKTQIIAFGDKCYFQYGFNKKKLSYIELEYDSPDKFDNEIVPDGESFHDAFTRSRKIMKNIQTDFKYSVCFVQDGRRNRDSIPLPITEEDIYSVQNKLMALLTLPQNNPNLFTTGTFIMQFDNDRSLAQLSFEKRRAHKFNNDKRFYEWLIVRLRIWDKNAS